jgi:crotonobetainyl-CoA:carnitine CoA-transferase CaiB-like acyl-CoA transferase
VVLVEGLIRGVNNNRSTGSFAFSCGIIYTATVRCVAEEHSGNRNKKSLAVSFKDIRGQRILQELATHSDVLVENYLPGTLAKYGLGYEDLRKINPGLIYASITG